MRISRKLVVTFLLVSLIPLLLGAAIAKSTLTHFQHDYSAPRLQISVMGMQSVNYVRFTNVARLFNTFALTLAATRAEGNARSALLRNYAAINPLYTNLALVDANGVVLASARN